MEQSKTVRLARILRVLITFVFICNLLVLPLVPGIVSYSTQGGFAQFAEFWAYEWDDALWNFFFRQPQIALAATHTAILTFFLLFCGTCTAMILWQARGVLGTIVKEDTFTRPNAARMKKAAVCFFLISLAALARTVWGFFYYRSVSPLFTYNALFIPIFLMGGLLCMVMSALFRQAAELKEENDLTI